MRPLHRPDDEGRPFTTRWTILCRILLVESSVKHIARSALDFAAYEDGSSCYIGEGPGGCCGDDRLFELLDQQWAKVAEHRPVQWFGIHDYVTVYDRRAK